MPVKTVLIVGGGIAGTAAAIMLSKRGIACDVVERKAKAAGATISLLNRSINGLQDLGILDHVLAQATVTTPAAHWRYLDRGGEEMAAPSMPWEPDPALPWGLYIMRPHLIDIMRNAAIQAGATIRMGIAADGFEEEPDGITARFSDGTVRRYDLLIGADGVHSSVRATFFPDSPPAVYSGATMFRGMFSGLSADLPSGAYVSGDHMVMTHRVPDGRVYMATGQKYADRPWIEQDEARRIVRDILSNYTAPLIRGFADRITDDYQIVVNDYNLLLVPSPWHRRRVLLIGDAAHATAANLSYGGGLAIEDGVVLGQEMTAGRDLEACLRSFMQRRFERARLVVETAVNVQRLQENGASASEQNMLRAAAMAELNKPY